MSLEALCVLAIAGSLASLITAVVTSLRSTPQRVRKAAQLAIEIAEDAQQTVRAATNAMISFQAEITREREACQSILDDAEKKRRQAAASLSKQKAATPDEEVVPQTVAEALALLPIGDPRRLVILRAANGQREAHA